VKTPEPSYKTGALLWQSSSKSPFVHNRTIIWAVDPFANDDGLQATTLSILTHSFPSAPIYPVYVLSEEAFHEHGDSIFLRPALKPLALKELDALTAQTASGNIKAPRVLLESSASRASCARKLLKFSDRIGAAMIALSTHGRNPLSRFFIGSFSEEMIHSSDIPLLFTGPETKPIETSPKVVVFPTDFSVECAKALNGIISLASRLGAELHLFHKTVHTIDPVLQSGVHVLGGGWVSLESFWSDENDSYKEDADLWIERAETQGVKAKFVSERFTEPVHRSILDYVSHLESESPVLAMVSHGGTVASRLLGSVTKEVIRRSPCPVYVVA
jgi:nucleotide-binding universal stress UspA family protein